MRLQCPRIQRLLRIPSGHGYHVKPNPELQYDSLSPRKRPDFQTALSGEDYYSAHFESHQALASSLYLDPDFADLRRADSHRRINLG
jgi:hypothetical protein